MRRLLFGNLSTSSWTRSDSQLSENSLRSWLLRQPRTRRPSSADLPARAARFAGQCARGADSAGRVTQLDIRGPHARDCVSTPEQRRTRFRTGQVAPRWIVTTAGLLPGVDLQRLTYPRAHSRSLARPTRRRPGRRCVVVPPCGGVLVIRVCAYGRGPGGRRDGAGETEGGAAGLSLIATRPSCFSSPARYKQAGLPVRPSLALPPLHDAPALLPPLPLPRRPPPLTTFPPF